MESPPEASYEFPSLSEVLRWRDRPLVIQVAEEASKSHLTFVASLASQVARAHADGDEVIKTLLALEGGTLERVLVAPETCRRLYSALDGDREAWNEFQGSLTLEAWKAPPPATSTSNDWSGLADVGSKLKDPGSMSSSHVVHDRVVVDFTSPAASRELLESGFRPKFGSPIPFDASQRHVILDRITRAMDALADSLPIQYSFVTQITRTVVPRQDLGNPSFKGSSNQTEIGRINLFNPHRDGLTTVPIATSLIHESIHNFLYIQEHRVPIVVDKALALDTRIRSPWSGKLVDLRALVHATFVWYALSFTWNSLPASSKFSSEDVDYFKEFCARGFLGDEIGSVLEPWKDAIRPDVWTQLSMLSANHSRLGPVLDDLP